MSTQPSYLAKAVRYASLLLVFFSLACTAPPTWADLRNIPRYTLKIVLNDESATSTQIANQLLQRFTGAHVVREIAPSDGENKTMMYIAIGPSALRYLVTQAPKGLIVSAFSSSQAYRSILGGAESRPALNITAVYAEPSPALQLRLISMLYKGRIKVAAILSENTLFLRPEMERVAAQSGIDFDVEQFDSGDNINRILNRIASVPVLLAIPDSTVFSVENIRNILITSYRHNQAVVGYSAAFVKAGAMMSAYSEVVDIIDQVEEIIADYQHHGKLAEPQFPKYFQVLANDDVARSLNVPIDQAVKSLRHKAQGSP